MLSIMLSGTIAKSPETRTSKNGNSYTLASIRIPSAEGDLFASITAFSELAPTLAGLAKGDPVTIVGTGKVSTYQGKDGDTRAGLSITASRIIALADHQAPPRASKSKGDGQGRRHAAAGAAPRQDQPPLEAYDDPIPF